VVEVVGARAIAGEERLAAARRARDPERRGAAAQPRRQRALDPRGAALEARHEIRASRAARLRVEVLVHRGVHAREMHMRLLDAALHDARARLRREIGKNRGKNLCERRPTIDSHSRGLGTSRARPSSAMARGAPRSAAALQKASVATSVPSSSNSTASKSTCPWRGEPSTHAPS